MIQMFALLDSHAGLAGVIWSVFKVEQHFDHSGVQKFHSENSSSITIKSHRH